MENSPLQSAGLASNAALSARYGMSFRLSMPPWQRPYMRLFAYGRDRHVGTWHEMAGMRTQAALIPLLLSTPFTFRAALANASVLNSEPDATAPTAARLLNVPNPSNGLTASQTPPLDPFADIDTAAAAPGAIAHSEPPLTAAPALNWLGQWLHARLQNRWDDPAVDPDGATAIGWRPDDTGRAPNPPIADGDSALPTNSSAALLDQPRANPRSGLTMPEDAAFGLQDALFGYSNSNPAYALAVIEIGGLVNARLRDRDDGTVIDLPAAGSASFFPISVDDITRFEIVPDQDFFGPVWFAFRLQSEGGGTTAPTGITIDVVQRHDDPPFLPPRAPLGVDENNPAIGQIAGASTPEVGARLSYHITGANPHNLLLSPDGVLTRPGGFDFEILSAGEQQHGIMLSMVVWSSLGGTTLDSAPQTVRVKVQDLLDEAVSIAAPSPLRIDEHVPAGHVITRLQHSTDEKGASIRYFLRGTSDHIAVTPDGEVMVKADIDFEALTPYEQRNGLEIAVQAELSRGDLPPVRTAVLPLVIRVNNLNDTPLTWDLPARVEVLENTSDTGVNIKTAARHDAAGHAISYQILDPAMAAIFTIADNGHLMFRQPPDFDAPGSVTQFDVAVRATSASRVAGDMAQMLDRMITVVVTNSDDNAARLLSPVLRAVEITAGANGARSVQAEARDADGDAVMFRLAPAASRNDNQRVEAVSVNGEITFRPGQFDYETVPRQDADGRFVLIDLQLQSQHPGQPPRTVVETVKVYIDDDNIRPKLTVTPVTQGVLSSRETYRFEIASFGINEPHDGAERIDIFARQGSETPVRLGHFNRRDEELENPFSSEPYRLTQFEPVPRTEGLSYDQGQMSISVLGDSINTLYAHFDPLRGRGTGSPLNKMKAGETMPFGMTFEARDQLGRRSDEVHAVLPLKAVEDRPILVDYGAAVRPATAAEKWAWWDMDRVWHIDKQVGLEASPPETITLSENQNFAWQFLAVDEDGRFLTGADSYLKQTGHSNADYIAMLTGFIAKHMSLHNGMSVWPTPTQSNIYQPFDQPDATDLFEIVPALDGQGQVMTSPMPGNPDVRLPVFSLQLKAPPDFESGRFNNPVMVTMRVRDTDDARDILLPFIERSFRLTVENKNDEVPVLPALSPITIGENNPNIGRITGAHTREIGASMGYIIGEPNPYNVAVSPDGVLTRPGGFDFESLSADEQQHGIMLSVAALASLGGINLQSVPQQTRIRVLDQLELAPSPTALPATTVAEGHATGTTLFTVHATADWVNGAPVPVVFLTDHPLLQVDPASGQVSFRTVPDYEPLLQAARAGNPAATGPLALAPLVITASSHYQGTTLSSQQSYSISISNLPYDVIGLRPIADATAPGGLETVGLLFRDTDDAGRPFYRGDSDSSHLDRDDVNGNQLFLLGNSQTWRSTAGVEAWGRYGKFMMNDVDQLTYQLPDFWYKPGVTSSLLPFIGTGAVLHDRGDLYIKSINPAQTVIKPVYATITVTSDGYAGRTPVIDVELSLIRPAGYNAPDPRWPFPQPYNLRLDRNAHPDVIAERHPESGQGDLSAIKLADIGVSDFNGRDIAAPAALAIGQPSLRRGAEYFEIRQTDGRHELWLKPNIALNFETAQRNSYMTRNAAGQDVRVFVATISTTAAAIGDISFRLEVGDRLFAPTIERTGTAGSRLIVTDHENQGMRLVVNQLPVLNTAPDTPNYALQTGGRAVVSTSYGDLLLTSRVLDPAGLNARYELTFGAVDPSSTTAAYRALARNSEAQVTVTVEADNPQIQTGTPAQERIDATFTGVNDAPIMRPVTIGLSPIFGQVVPFTPEMLDILEYDIDPRTGAPELWQKIVLTARSSHDVLWWQGDLPALFGISPNSNPFLLRDIAVNGRFELHVPYADLHKLSMQWSLSALIKMAVGRDTRADFTAYAVDKYGARSNEAVITVTTPEPPAGGFHTMLGALTTYSFDAVFGWNTNFMTRILQFYTPKSGPDIPAAFTELQPTHVRIISPFLTKITFADGQLLNPIASPHKVDGPAVTYVDWAYHDVRGADLRDYATAKAHDASVNQGRDYKRADHSVFYYHLSFDGGLSWSRQIPHFLDSNDARIWYRDKGLTGYVTPDPIAQVFAPTWPVFDDDVSQTGNNIRTDPRVNHIWGFGNAENIWFAGSRQLSFGSANHVYKKGFSIGGDPAKKDTVLFSSFAGFSDEAAFTSVSQNIFAVVYDYDVQADDIQGALLHSLL